MNHARLCELANSCYDNFNVAAGVSQCLVTEEDGYQIFAFAGSKDIGDFLFDADAIPASMDGLGHVHKGFRDEYFMLRERLLQMAEESPLPKIMTGHSLGAPQAQFAAWDFGRIMLIYEVVTFGCPKGFTTEAMAAYHCLTTNYIHGRDVVPDLPGFLHRPGVDIFLDEMGGLLPAREPVEHLLEELRDRIKDHLLLGVEGYITAVKAYCSLAG